MTSPIPTTDPLFPAQWLSVAERICERFYREFPDTNERYGARGRAYCAHDNAYLVAWLMDALDSPGSGSFATNVAWLRELLEARGFPMKAFERNLELVADAAIEMRPADAPNILGLIGEARTAR